MINKLSSFITDRFVLNGTEQVDDIEVYQFALFIIISNIFFLAISLLTGLIFSCIIEMIIFFISFQLLRTFAGGYHAKSETVCEIATTSSIFLVGLIISLCEKFGLVQLFTIITAVIAAVVIIIFSPVEARQKPLSANERKKYRIVSILILAAITASIITAYCLKIRMIYIPCCLCLVLEAALITAGKIEEHFTVKE